MRAGCFLHQVLHLGVVLTKNEVVVIEVPYGRLLLANDKPIDVKREPVGDRAAVEDVDFMTLSLGGLSSLPWAGG